MSSLPLQGVRVLELAGLAPGPFAGMVLADFGADVVRVDRVDTAFNVDVLTRGKRSIAVSLKTKAGISLLRTLLSSPSSGRGNSWHADVLIDPFRPGVLERIGLDPKELMKANPRLIVARLTGFRRDGPYSMMAGHDINYVALSGVLSLLGGQAKKPTPPANLLADFAGGAMIAVLGVLAAIIERGRSGKGQIVEIDMVTGTRYVSSFPLIMSNPRLNLPLWNQPRGENYLDGGAPWYNTYETKDGKYMSVGALEPPFYSELIAILTRSLPPSFPHPPPSVSDQLERSTWPALETFFTDAFLLKTRQEWTRIFIGTEACCVPVLTKEEVDSSGRGKEEPGVSIDEDDSEGGGIPVPAPRLTRTPAKTGKAEVEGVFLEPGRDTVSFLKEAGLGEEIDALSRVGAISTGDEPVKSKL